MHSQSLPRPCSTCGNWPQPTIYPILGWTCAWCADRERRERRDAEARRWRLERELRQLQERLR